LKFETSQALGSHMKFKHEGKGVSSSSGEALDLKRDFMGLLEDVGVRRGTKTVSDIFFGLGSDSLENLDRILRLAGVTNPAKALIINRWGQRVDIEVPPQLLTGRDSQERTSDVFQAYEKVREAELTELLMEDLRERIKAKRRQSSGGDETKPLLDKLERLENEVKDLKLSQSLDDISRRHQPFTPPQAHESPEPRQLGAGAHPCNNPRHSPSCVVCGYCGFHGSIRRIPIGGDFTCPQCGATFLRDH
jgi:hypothetical protein